MHCLEAKIRTWTFERPQGGPVRIVYPLSFAPAGSREPGGVVPAD